MVGSQHARLRMVTENRKKNTVESYCLEKAKTLWPESFRLVLLRLVMCGGGPASQAKDGDRRIPGVSPYQALTSHTSATIQCNTFIS